jgi:hypothetical protein
VEAPARKMKCLSRAAWVALAMLASPGSFAQQLAATRPDLSGYTHFELRPVKTLNAVNPDAYEKFSSMLAKNLEGDIARWAEADRAQKGGKRLIFEVSLLDDKMDSAPKHHWLNPIRGSYRVSAQVEVIDAESGTVIARTVFKESAGAATTVGAMGSSGNRMIATLAWRSSNYIVGLLSSQLSVTPAGAGGSG